MQWNTKKIELELKRLGWNRSTLAKKIGLSRQSINQYFSLPVTIYKAQKIANALGLDAKDLLT